MIKKVMFFHSNIDRLIQYEYLFNEYRNYPKYVYRKLIVVENTNTNYTKVADRVVITYSDHENSSFGTAVIGDVNVEGEMIILGKPVVFESGNTSNISCCYDWVKDRIVIVYSDKGNSSFGTAIVGNVDSGTESITFGKPVVFESGNTSNISCCYDPVEDRVVIAYTDNGNSYFGTVIIGIVDSRTESIIFGTPVVFKSENTCNISCCYDRINNKIIITYDTLRACKNLAIIGGLVDNSIYF